MSNGLSNLYYVSLNLENYLNDPRTGLPLAGGYMNCYADNQRGTPKAVYQLAGDPPNYTYEVLPNPVPFSDNGMPMNEQNEIVRIYFYPWDLNGDLELYYLKIYASDGYLCYTIPAIPNLVEDSVVVAPNDTYENQLSNPQFFEVNFEQSTGFTLSLTGSGSDQEYQIAPDWFIRVSWSNSSNLIINQVFLEGSLNVPTNPPSVLQIQSSGSITSLQLVQKLSNNPDIWSTTTSAVGYAAGYMLVSSLDGQAHTVSMYYSPSVAPSPQLIVSGTTGLSGYKELLGTVELSAGVNSDTGESGYVEIYIDLPVNVNMYISSVQAVGLSSDIEVGYSQDTVNRQIDHLFNYYKDPLMFKPIPSWLVGWDFPVNPAQFGESGSFSALGANESAYVWDQTIAFQSASGALTYSRDSSNSQGLVFGAAANTQVAIIQYLPATEVTELLLNNMCASVTAFSSAGDYTYTVSIWYTTTTLPDLNANESIVASIDADGYPSSFYGTWTEITRDIGVNATGTISATNPVTTTFNGWQPLSITEFASATYVAFVIGVSEIETGNDICFVSAALQSGDIATIPAPKTYSETLRDCRYYYEKSYQESVAANSFTAKGALLEPQTFPISVFSGSTYNGEIYESAFQINYKESKISDSSEVTIYPVISGANDGYATFFVVTDGAYPSPSSGTNPTNFLITSWTVYEQSTENIQYLPATSSGVLSFTGGSVRTYSQAFINFHYVVDDRLGLVYGI